MSKTNRLLIPLLIGSGLTIALLLGAGWQFEAVSAARAAPQAHVPGHLAAPNTVSVANAAPQQLPRTLDRDEDPTVVTGDKMPSFNGAALEHLFVYAYNGGIWQQIPWQFDEVISGHITATEDTLLDADDQLVFMASDTGDQAPSGSWINNADSQQYPRYEITVSDPISPDQKGWVYVYRSTTDSDTVTTDYVNYDEAQWLFTTERYIVKIIPYRMTVERLEMNGSGVDILDRTKFSVYVSDPGPVLLTEDLVSLAEDPVIRDGRIRAFATLSEGSNEFSLIGYRSTYQFAAMIIVSATRL